MNTHTPDHRNHGLVIGVLKDTLVGAGLMMWIAPRPAADLRQPPTDSAEGLGEPAGICAGETLDEPTR